MILIKCDKCGEIKERHNGTMSQITFYDCQSYEKEKTAKEYRKDFCSKCFTKIAEFIEDKQSEEAK